jgi:hypothetical protein
MTVTFTLRRAALFMICATAMTGCTMVVPYRIAAVPTQHIVMVDSNGRLMDPTGSVFCHPERGAEDRARFIKDRPDLVAPPATHSWTPCNGRFNSVRLLELDRQVGDQFVRDADHYLDDFFANMDDWYAKNTPPGQQQKRKLVFIIHGGLNTNQTTLHRAQDLSQKLLNDGYYPVFINWQSNLFRALWSHLVKVRQGDDFGYKLAFLAPFYLVADVGKGVTRAPILWTSSLSNDFSRLYRAAKRGNILRVHSEVDEVYERLYSERIKFVGDPNCPAIDIERGEFMLRWSEGAKANARYLPTGAIPVRLLANAVGRAAPGPWALLPVKYLAAPLLDGFGSSAWEHMRRSAVLGFHTDGSSSEVFRDDPHASGSGGLSRFFVRLEKEIEADRRACRRTDGSTCVEWEMTLLAHSMGAIVSNHVLHNFPGLDFRRIVYMAGASSVREYEESVLEYMKDHPRTHMYHLLLDDLAEVHDQYFLEVPPSGSLLVWVDRFFTRPGTLRDRTVGRYDNLIRFLDDTPEELKRRVHVRVFGIGGALKDVEPQSHGAFGEFYGARPRDRKFWDPAFWRTDVAGVDDVDDLVAGTQ